jgi:hypothetical protein
VRDELLDAGHLYEAAGDHRQVLVRSVLPRHHLLPRIEILMDELGIETLELVEIV